MPDEAGRVVRGRLLRRGDEEEAADRAFWEAMTGEQRVELLWELVREARTIKGLEGDEPRLQRSVGGLRRA